jgi:hypothetical protein
VRSRNGKGFVEVDGGVVGWINGGEPMLGCELVSLMIFAPTRADVKVRAREIGLWSPYVMDRFGDLDPHGVAAAVADPEGFVWNDARSEDCWPSAELSRPDR